MACLLREGIFQVESRRFGVRHDAQRFLKVKDCFIDSAKPGQSAVEFVMRRSIIRLKLDCPGKCANDGIYITSGSQGNSKIIMGFAVVRLRSDRQGVT